MIASFQLIEPRVDGLLTAWDFLAAARRANSQ